MNRAVIVPVPPNNRNDALLGLGAIASSSSRLFRLRRPIAPGGVRVTADAVLPS